MKVAPNDGVNENARVLGGVSRRHVNHVGLHHHCAVIVDGGGGGAAVEGGDGAVVGEAMVAADHAEGDDVAAVIEEVEALGADGGGEAGDDADLAEGADCGAVAEDEVAGLDEVLVGLGVVEAADDGPHGGQRGGDLLDNGGAALVGGNGVGVVTGHGGRDSRRTWWWWWWWWGWWHFCVCEFDENDDDVF